MDTSGPQRTSSRTRTQPQPLVYSVMGGTNPTPTPTHAATTRTVVPRDLTRELRTQNSNVNSTRSVNDWNPNAQATHEGLGILAGVIHNAPIYWQVDSSSTTNNSLSVSLITNEETVASNVAHRNQAVTATGVFDVPSDDTQVNFVNLVSATTRGGTLRTDEATRHETKMVTDQGGTHAEMILISEALRTQSPLRAVGVSTDICQLCGIVLSHYGVRSTNTTLTEVSPSQSTWRDPWTGHTLSGTDKPATLRAMLPSHPKPGWWT